MRRLLYLFMSITGIILLYLATRVFVTEQTATLSGFGYGLGGVFTVLGAGYLIYSFVVPQEKAKEYRRQNQIEVQDERNVVIKEKASAMVSHIMTYLLSGCIILFSFLQVDKWIIVTIAGLLLGKGVLFTVFINYYAKRL